MYEIILPSRYIWTPDKSKWSIVQLAGMEIFKRLLEGKVDINTLYWRDFEQLIACLLTLEGYETWIGPGQKDGGVDVIAFKDIRGIGRIMTIWQIKKLERKNKVDVDVVSLLAEARSRLGANKGIIVTTTSLTKNAYQRLKDYNYFLESYEGKDVSRWIIDVLNMNIVRQWKTVVNVDTQGVISEDTLIKAGVPEQYTKDARSLMPFTMQSTSSWSLHRPVLFVLGRQRSGKSTAINLITNLANGRGYTITYMKDYDILYDMYQRDIDHWKFRNLEYGGFDVLDLSVLDVALMQLEEQIKKRKMEQQFVSTDQKEIILTELIARDDYSRTFRNFSTGFLREVYCLFIEADLDICSQRMHLRQTSNPLIDNYSISHFSTKYDHMYDLSFYEELKDLGVEDITLIHNNGLLKEFAQQVQTFAMSIFGINEPIQLLYS